MVRKYIEKRPDIWIHYETLQRQYEDLKRWNYLSPGLVPRILSMYESKDEYYFDMEYVEGYKELSMLPSSYQQHILPRVISTLYNDIYCFSKLINGQQWLELFINDKIRSKYNMISSISPSFHHLIHDEYIVINSVRVQGITSLFSNMNVWNNMAPVSVSPIHGDLTLENILVHPETLEFKLIDPSGSRYVDPVEMDLAKLYQYTVASYTEWENKKISIEQGEHGWSFTTDLEIKLDSMLEWENSFSISNSKAKGLFYVCTYFLRMIPFLLQHSEEKALYGLVFATYYLKHSLLL
jgi:serine/threonine protein kinase